MSRRKLFAGAAVRRFREEAAWSQQALAKRLKISTSYLNQIEHNQRPVTASVLIALTQIFRVDVSVFSDSGADRLLTDLREALSDPVLSKSTIGLPELKAATQYAPRVARAVIQLQSAHRALTERYQSLDSALSEPNISPTGASVAFPYEEVRDFFHAIGNYVDPLDRSAERLFAELGSSTTDLEEALIDRLRAKHKVVVAVDKSFDPGRPIRQFDRASRKLQIDGSAEKPSRTFALAHQIALIEAFDTIQEVLRQAAFRSENANAVCSVALANYFAGATILPYSRFLDEARRHRHDLEILAHRFGASLEQVSHRLSTMQRPGSHGVPFYFLRVDRAGNITKRHSATRFQFARYGGACPLWNVHEAFEMPDRMLVQLAEMPDGTRYLSLALALTKSGIGYSATRRRYAIGLGCELPDADQVVYADGLDRSSETLLARIGVSCRLCDRSDCPQRAFPPAGRTISIDHDIREVVPYTIVRGN